MVQSGIGIKVLTRKVASRKVSVVNESKYIMDVGSREQVGYSHRDFNNRHRRQTCRAIFYESNQAQILHKK